jgi:hypothetical protein
MFPNMAVQRFANSNYLRFNVLGDGYCGFYAAILSYIAHIGSSYTLNHIIKNTFGDKLNNLYSDEHSEVLVKVS